MKSVVEKYLEVVLGKQLPAEERLSALLNVLNELQSPASQLKDVKFSDCDGDPPADLSNGFYVRITHNFPELGNYSLVSPTEPANQTVMIGDAINDAADIASDLSKSIWRWKHTYESDALWHLELAYRTHWGRHLNDLRWYVYELMIA